MPCDGECKLEQYEWTPAKERTLEITDPGGETHINPNNGTGYKNPAASRIKVDRDYNINDVWEGLDKDPDKFNDLIITLGFDFSGEWETGVELEFPRWPRQITCLGAGCDCTFDINDAPDYPEEFIPYEVFVPHVFPRTDVENEPDKVWIEIIMLKGQINARRRVIVGECNRSNDKPIVTGFRKPQNSEEEGH